MGLESGINEARQLAMLEACVSDLGGTYAFCDTDSLAIVATSDGRLIPCAGGDVTDDKGRDCVRSLTYDQCADIRARFAGLSPYDPELVPALLKDECRGTAIVISAKRYVIYNRDENGQVRLEKFSEHGLGHVQSPSDGSDRNDWIRDFWARVADFKDGKPLASEPTWRDRITVGSHTVTSPHLHRAFHTINDGKDYRDQIKPFSFMNVAHLADDPTPGRDSAAWPSWVPETPTGQLIAPFERDPNQWERTRWIDKGNPDEVRYEVASAASMGGYLRKPTRNRPVMIYGRTYDELLDNYATHPEAKFIGRIGLLKRRPTIIASAKLIGKEANNLEEVTAGLNPETLVTEYAIRLDNHDATIRRILARFTDSELATHTQNDRAPGRAGRLGGRTASLATVKRWRAGKRVSDAVALRLTYTACRTAEQDLRELDAAQQQPTVSGVNVDRDREWTHDQGSILGEWKKRVGDVTGDGGSLCACGCGKPTASARARYANDACRKRDKRAKQAEEAAERTTPGDAPAL